MVWDLFSRRQRRLIVLMIPAVTVTALLQVVGIASVLPFLSLVADPGLIERHHVLSWLYGVLHFGSQDAFLVFAGIAALALLLIANGLNALTEWRMLGFGWRLSQRLGEQLLEQYLAKPYAWFLDRNSAELVKIMLAEVRQTVSGYVLPGLQLVVRTVVALAILALLMVANPMLATASLVVLGASYSALYLLVRRQLKRIGELRSDANREMFKSASEVLAGVKDIKLLGREGVFRARFGTSSRRYAHYMAQQQVVAQLPHYAMESVAFGAMLFVVLFLLMQGRDVSGIVPILGLFGFATYRLLPSLQIIFSSVAAMRFSLPALEQVHADLAELRTRQLIDRRDLVPLPFTDRIEMRGVTFQYAAAAKPVLRDFDLSIAANTSVAFVGPTGSGKTTTVDILLGLLHPERGQLLIDGVVVDEALAPRWQMNIGYVPQQIFLADDTITANIALGVRPRDVDRVAVERAARLANIHDFITTELPRGYDTVIGERGVRLSGGQRQRLGIARALYDDPAVLVLDEATSALDGVTEEAIFDAVREIGRRKTVVMIAHRLATVQQCDVIHVLDGGSLIGSGTHGALLARCPQYRALARLGQNDQPAPPEITRPGSGRPV